MKGTGKSAACKTTDNNKAADLIKPAGKEIDFGSLQTDKTDCGSNWLMLPENTFINDERIKSMLKIAFHPLYVHKLPAGHRYPMAKYELLPQLLKLNGTCSPQNFFTPDITAGSNYSEIERHVLKIHNRDYYDNLRLQKLDKKSVRAIGFPLTEALVTRELLITKGTIENCEYALLNGISMNIAGGTHHAYPGHGEGFCIFNDQAVAAAYLLDKYGSSAETRKNAPDITINNILIIDLDVHQGNGTAKIFENQDSVFTFSMHGAGNYPFKKEKSDLDIPLPDGTGDKAYLKLLKNTLPGLLEKVKPDFIFYQAGVDILKTDKLGRLACTLEGCKERDRFVLQACKNAGIPVQVSMGGGYSQELTVIIAAHAQTFAAAQDIYFG